MYILSSSRIRAFVEAVLCLPPTMVTGEPDPDQVKELLAEMLDVWPASIFPCLGEPDDPEDPDDLEPTVAVLDAMPADAGD